MSDKGLYIISWMDHYSNDGWTDPDDFQPEDYIVSSVGWLIVENDHYICLAGSLSNSNAANSIMCILKSDIIEKKKLKSKAIKE